MQKSESKKQNTRLREDCECDTYQQNRPRNACSGNAQGFRQPKQCSKNARHQPAGSAGVWQKQIKLFFQITPYAASHWRAGQSQTRVECQCLLSCRAAGENLCAAAAISQAAIGHQGMDDKPNKPADLSISAHRFYATAASNRPCIVCERPSPVRDRGAGIRVTPARTSKGKHDAMAHHQWLLAAVAVDVSKTTLTLCAAAKSVIRSCKAS